MLHQIQNKTLLILSVIILLMLGFNLDVIPVSIMEARNFITAREMITDNNWLLTTMNGEPRYQKPPLPSWICAAFGLVFGINNTIALRFPALIFIVITSYYSNLIAREITKNSAQGFNTALISISSLYIIVIAFEAPSDIFTHGFMLMGIYQLLLLFRTQSKFVKRGVFAGIFIGCSILSKGPVSFYVLLLPFFIAYGFSFKYEFSKKLVLSFLGCLILAIAIGGSWYAYVRLEDAETFIQIAEKETGNWTSYNIRPFYYYWSFFVQSGLWTIPAFVGLLYPYLKTRVSNLRAYKFSLFWTLIAVILLSVIPEKKSRYLMPVLIPLAINTGFYIEYLISQFKRITKKAELVPVYTHFILIAVIAIAVPFGVYFAIGQNIDNYLFNAILLGTAAAILGIWMLFKLKQKDLRTLFYLNVLFFMMLLSLGLPLLNTFKSQNFNSPRDLLLFAETNQIEIYRFGSISPEMIYEYGDKLKSIQTDKGVKLPKQEQFGLLTTDSRINKISDFINQYEIKKIETFDLNISEESAKSHKDRLQNSFYILRKK